MAAGNRDMRVGGWMLLSGVILFSGSIYALILRPQWRVLGPVTPIGGLLLITGWLTLATVNPFIRN
jgi:uncharacterized membrane protein YgdD (TMEM256/DUF423 family)